MAHLHRLRLDEQEPGGHGGLERLLIQVEHRRSAAYDEELAGVIGCSEQQHRLHRRRQPPAAFEKRLLDPGGEVERRRQRRGPAELVDAELGGQLEQRERVAAALGNEPFGDLRGGRVPQSLVQQRSGILGGEPGQRHLRDAVGSEGCGRPVTRREHQEHAVGTEPTGAEQQRVGGC